MAQRWITAVIVLLCICSCDRSRGLVAYWRFSPYHGAWEYRYGESPDSSLQPNTPEWVSPEHQDGGWRQAINLGVPPGRQNATTLWLRTHLSGPSFRQPMIALATRTEDLQVFLDGRLIYDTQPGQPVGAAALLPLVPIDQDYQGKMLVVRVHASGLLVGLADSLLIGEGTAVLADWIRRGTLAAIMVTLMVWLGLGSLILSVFRRNEETYFYYGGFCFSVGLMVFIFTRLPPLWISLQLRWVTIMPLSLAMTLFFLVGYVRAATAPGSTGILIWLFWLSFASFLLVAPLASGRLVATDRIFFGLLIQCILVGLAVAAVAIVRAWHGDTDAKILGIGILGFAGVIIWEGIGQLSRTKNSIPSTPYGTMMLVVAGSIVQIRRFLGIHQRAVRLAVETAVAQARLSEQGSLLTAAARMANGDLDTSIVVSADSDLLPLASALDQMRKSVAGQMRSLRDKNIEVQQLNDELRRQIEQRTGHLMKLMIKSGGGGGGTARALTPGEALGDHYRIISVLGQGAMGRVYEVERITDGRRLAAKLMTEASTRMALMRFAREAQILAQLNHPNLIQITDIDIDASGAFFLVMELVVGKTLKQYMEHTRSPQVALPVLLQIAAGLRAMHACGILHRDLKPANILVADGDDPQPQVKIADFGLSALLQTPGDPRIPPGSRSSSASVTDEQPTPNFESPLSAAIDPLSETQHDPPGEKGAATEPTLSAHLAALPSASVRTLTQTGMVIGTPLYMAPELTTGARGAEPAADMFSFGVIAVELLTGKLPFEDPPLVMAWRGARYTPPDLRTRLAHVSPDIVELIQRCLSDVPAERPHAAEATEILLAATAPPAE